jgi:pyrimidine-specific ribonucleoside hydrolase
MGGALRVPGNVERPGGAPAVAEWNVFADPAAAAVVFRSGVPLLVVPLDATNQVPIDRSFLSALGETARGRLGVVAAQLLALGCTAESCEGHYAWDPLAAAVLVDEATVHTEPVEIEVVTGGPGAGRMLAGDARDGATRAATSADAAAFRRVFLSSFRADPAPRHPERGRDGGRPGNLPRP